MAALLECRDLCKRYGGFQALEDINLQLQPGKIVGLLGPNGSGKTTLIKLINGLLSPTMGEILIQGEPVGVETKKIVSYLPDKNYLNNWMSVKQLLHFMKDFYEDFNYKKAQEMLGHLQISENMKLKAMSKGTKEKVQLVLVMSRDAQLYILDEPIAGVDPAARDYILNTIFTNYNPGATVLISTHLIADIEKVLNEVIFLKQGHIVLHEDANTLREREQKSIDALFREVFAC